MSDERSSRNEDFCRQSWLREKSLVIDCTTLFSHVQKKIISAELSRPTIIQISRKFSVCKKTGLDWSQTAGHHRQAWGLQQVGRKLKLQKKVGVRELSRQTNRDDSPKKHKKPNLQKKHRSRPDSNRNLLRSQALALALR